MSAQNSKAASVFFLVGALFNWLITLAWFFAYPSVFPLMGMEAPENPMFMQLFSALAFVFGVGYFLVSRAPESGGDIVLMGIIGKLMVFAIIAYYWLQDAVSLILFLIGCGDLSFAIVMVLFLMFSKVRQATC